LLILSILLILSKYLKSYRQLFPEVSDYLLDSPGPLSYV